MTHRNPRGRRLIAYWKDETGWHKQYTDSPSDFLRYGTRPPEARGSMTHWAICAAEKDDGGMTPPPGVPIYKEKDD